MPKKDPKEKNRVKGKSLGARQQPKPPKAKLIKELQVQVDAMAQEQSKMRKQLTDMVNVVMELQSNSNQDARTIQSLSSRINGCFTFLSLSYDNIEKAIETMQEYIDWDDSLKEQNIYEVLSFIREAQKYLMPNDKAMELYEKIKEQTDKAEAELKKQAEEEEKKEDTGEEDE